MDKVRCTRCGETKDIGQFAPSHIRQNRTGEVVGVCRLCNTEYQKEIRQRNNCSGLAKIETTSFVCAVCNTEKPAADFRWNSRIGYKAECKECEKTWLRCSKCDKIKKHESFPPSKISATSRHSWCHDCHTARELEKYRGDPEHREKHKARVAVGAAVKKGRLTKPTTCQANGKYGAGCIGVGPDGGLKGHHHLGYWPKAVWLEVEWLCPACHAVADMQQKATGYLVLSDLNPGLAAAKDQLARAFSWLSIDARGLFDLTMACSGEDEMTVILNFLEWLEKNGMTVSPQAPPQANGLLFP